MSNSLQQNKGHPSPLGATAEGDSINFALWAPKADKAQLSIFTCEQDTSIGTFNLNLTENRTGEIWHIALQGLPPTFDYTWFLDGPHLNKADLPFQMNRTLVDPYAHALNTPATWMSPQPPTLRARYLESQSFDWQDVRKPSIPHEQLIIYEMHVRSFTIDKSSDCKHPGTYLGIVEKIPYLKELGVNAIELLPIYEFDETAYKVVDPTTQRPLCNYWGYSTVSFFCPMRRFGTSQGIAAAITEFKTMVRELHKAGIEVILDVVYNHTSEGLNRIFSWKGIDNSHYYLVDNQGNDLNFSGTGNTFACNAAATQELILQSLRFWADEMQVDGFRFDLASVLTRGENGTPLKTPPVLIAIANDPYLRSVKLIAEGWDAAGLYQLGEFPSWGPWSEWNGKYRDSVRRFIKGTDGYAGAFAASISGSQELYRPYPLGPLHSVNFVTCHDGFSLHDLTNYQGKHNLRNGEENRDGNDQNDSWNCGFEGPTDDPNIVELRQRQMRNFHLALMLSLGIPMVLMGDEYGHTKEGNNNTWCQDNELNWFNWKTLDHNEDFFRFFQKLIHFRKKHPLLRRKKFYSQHDITWYGLNGSSPDWSEKSRFVAACLNAKSHRLFFAFNADFSPASFTLPPLKNHKGWTRIIDTSLLPPQDFSDHPEALQNSSYTLPSHAAALFESG